MGDDMHIKCTRRSKYDFFGFELSVFKKLLDFDIRLIYFKLSQTTKSLKSSPNTFFFIHKTRTLKLLKKNKYWIIWTKQYW